MKKEKEKIDFKYNIKEYWKLLREQKLIFFVLLFMSLLGAALHIIDKFLFKIIIDDGTEFLAGNLLGDIFIKTLIILAIIFVSAVVIRTLVRWLTIHLVIVLDSRLVIDLKRKYFNHILDLSHQFHTTHKTGSLVSKMLRGSGAVEEMTGILTFNFAPLIFNLIIVFFSLVYFDLIPAVVLIITTTVFILYSYRIQHIQQKHKLKLNRTEDREKGMISDVFANIDSIKYLGKEPLIKNRYFKAADKARRAAVKYGGYFRWFDAGQMLILGLGTFFLLYFPLVNFLNGDLSLGTLVFIYTVYGNVVGPMFGFVWGMRGFYMSMADFQELFKYGKIENEIKNKPGAKDIEIKKGIIEFRNISFNYGKRRLLKNFNLKIKENEKIALVGHSGCGKTTVVKLFNRFYDVDSGAILIDNKDIRDFKQESVRRETGIVPQECILFDDTIYNNIKFANLKATRKEVMRAIKFARLDKTIKDFPKKENTIVGERGVKLSGGEKQRVSIARAILANKKILVLDEATSSLDSETEYEIQQALKKLLESRTSIIIAHRLSTIMNADRIIVMKGGRIVQEGKHSELIKQKGEYKKLWDLQKGGYIA